MKELLLWLVVLTPTPKCVDDARKANLTNCREESAKCYVGIGEWPYGDCSKKVQVCDEVDHPKPIPEVKFEFRLEHPGWREQADPCFERAIKKVKLEDDSDAQVVFASSVSLSGSIVFSTTSTLVTTPSANSARGKKKRGR